MELGTRGLGNTHARALVLHVLQAGDHVGDAAEADAAAKAQRHQTIKHPC